MTDSKIAKRIHDVNFTAYEIECAEFLIKHVSVNQIAEKLNVSPDTVNSYISSMKQKIGCNTKIELIEWLFES